MARKKTWKWARRVSLAAHRKALRLAEDDDWDGAWALTFGHPCAFCETFTAIYGDEQEHPGCAECPARPICRRRKPQGNAYLVLKGRRTPAAGLQHFRKTISQLEGLDL